MSRINWKQRALLAEEELRVYKDREQARNELYLRVQEYQREMYAAMDQDRD